MCGNSAERIQISAHGSLTNIDSFPSLYISPRPVVIWKPFDYDSTKKYAVLYMHDGQMLFDSTTTWNKKEWEADETMSRLFRENKIRDAIVIGI